MENLSKFCNLYNKLKINNRYFLMILKYDFIHLNMIVYNFNNIYLGVFIRETSFIISIYKKNIIFII